MYDWNALWHQHQGYRTGYDGADQDINHLAQALGAKQVKPAHGHEDIAVYDSGDHFILVGQQAGLQILNLAKHALFKIDIQFISQENGAALALPFIEVRVENAATSEQASWRGAIRRDEHDVIYLEKRPLSEGVMPAMPFDSLSFTDQARFRDALYREWPLAIERLLPEIQAWRPASARAPLMLARYKEILRHEQAALSRLFSGEERARLNAVLGEYNFNEPAACRGLWLKVEASLMDSASEADLAPLLEKMRTLSYAQEVALIESL